mgnify:CR=1 FL=1|jgi:hypothetical protein
MKNQIYNQEEEERKRKHRKWKYKSFLKDVKKQKGKILRQKIVKKEIWFYETYKS